MWILSVLSDYAIHTIFGIGCLGVLLGFVLSFIPIIGRYKFPIQIISILILVLGVYLEGGLENESLWKLKVKEIEAKVAKTEVQSATVNTEIVEKIVNKKVVIKEKGDEIIKYVDQIQYVDKEIVKYINQCPIPESIIKIHNAAALNDNSGLLSLSKDSK
jgi:hypothetical protein